jgi:uncharacterized cofD-like protein
MHKLSASVGRHASAPVSTSAKEHLRIVALGGGTGLPAVLRAVRMIVGPDAPASAITAIVAVTDDGGSSGELRRQYGVLPPGDIRNCVAALAGDSSAMASLLQHRFQQGHGLEGHPVGNLILTALTQQFGGDFPSAVEVFAKLAGIGGRVLPATADDVHLRAEHASGEVTVGETAIVSRRLPIRRLSLERPVRPLPDAIEALVNADVIIVGPGSLYTSILPVLLVNGVAATISGVRATRICVSNLMTEPGETDDYCLEDHLDAIEQHVGFNLFDYVLVNDGRVGAEAEARYAAEKSVLVRQKFAHSEYKGAGIVRRAVSITNEDGTVRHHPAALASALLEVACCGRPESQSGRRRAAAGL